MYIKIIHFLLAAGHTRLLTLTRYNSDIYYFGHQNNIYILYL